MKITDFEKHQLSNAMQQYYDFKINNLDAVVFFQLGDFYEMFFEDYTQKVWGIHPSEISPEWGSQRVKGLSLFKALLNVIIKPFKKGKNVEIEGKQF